MKPSPDTLAVKPALLLVDLQNDFLSSPSLEPHRGFITRNSEQMLLHCRQQGIPVIHVLTTIDSDGGNRMPHWKEMDTWSCVSGTTGHETPALLTPLPDERVVHKSFFSAFSTPALDEVLVKLQIDTLWICGVHTHGCIRSTALDAYTRGLSTVVIDDAVGSDDPLHAQITRRYLRRRAVRFAVSDEMTGSVETPRADTEVARITARVASAVTAAQAAAGAWRRHEDEERLAFLERLASGIEGEASSLTDAIVGEIHKPLRYALEETARSSELIRAICRSVRADRDVSRPRSQARRTPHGTLAIITPWNNPLAIPTGKIVAALAFGNSVVWKPSPKCPDISRKFLSLCSEAGIPHDVLLQIEGGSEIAEALMEASGIDGVAITGSLQAGRSAQEITSVRMIPLQAELGGNNAAIVWEGCDLAEAARLIAEAAFGFAGQRCTANRRVIVSSSSHQGFLDHLILATQALPWGDPAEARTIVGPMIDEPASMRIDRLIEAAKQRFETIVPHQSAPAGPGAWYAPTIVVCDDPSDEIVQEESFGPVLVVQRARSWDEAMYLCNGVRQGLVASIFSTNPDLCSDFVDRARAGIVKVNLATSGADAELPFGGWKQSGIGPPEHGPGNREFYTRWQSRYDGHRERG
ncbi:MAG TPA: aldehyde dehydrogenase family protein [Thermoanaerobaculia bacterium]|nr:aldehyde dehydrogenase family protein [Thermoanaerobaculia bacterium]